MARIAVKDQVFRAMYFSDTQVFSDLLLLIYRTDINGNAIDTLTPIASTMQLGLQYADYVFTNSGPHILKWYSVAESLTVYETVSVLESEDRYPMHSVVSVGTPYYPEYKAATGAGVMCHVFTPDLVDEVNSPFDTDELGTGLFRTTDILTPSETGPFLVTWYVDGSFDSYQVYDVYQPVTARAVTLAFRVPGTLLPYQDLHLTIMREDAGYTTTGFTRADGKFTTTLNDANYYVTIRDKNDTTRVFTANNFLFDVCDPTTRSSANDITWDIDWLDVPITDEIILPTAYKSIMHIRVLVGPSGVPSAYSSFTISTDVPIRVNNSMIAPGQSRYVLDITGAADVILIRNSRVTITFPLAKISTTFDVPDLATFNFSDIVGTDPFSITTPVVFYPYRTS